MKSWRTALGFLLWAGALTLHAQQQLTPAQLAYVLQQQAAAAAQQEQRRREEGATLQSQALLQAEEDTIGKQLAATINVALRAGKKISIYLVMQQDGWSYSVEAEATWSNGLLRVRCSMTNNGTFDLLIRPSQVHSVRIYDR